MIFAARQLQEKCQEMRIHLHSTFLDLKNALDTVNREGLWKIMQKFGCPERFVQMVRQLHDDMIARVADNGAVSEAFTVTDGVKQGCALAPTLFSLMLSAMLIDAYRDERPRIHIAYRTDGHLLNQCLMNFQSRVSTTKFTNFSSPTTVSTTPWKRTYKGAWTSPPPPARTSDWSSARRKRRSCIIRHRTRPLPTMRHRSGRKEPNCQWRTTSHTWAVPTAAAPKSMI
nr:unnamed protein product [Spirometra erinaceieuropaei]